ncbi:hypothetical protein [Azospirillum argentinense]
MNTLYHAPPRPVPATNPLFSGSVGIPAGITAAPGLGFVGDMDTGLYRPSANTLSVVVGGIPALTASPSGLVASGPVVAPIWRTAQVTIGDDAVYTHQMPAGNNSGVVLVYAISANYGAWLIQAFLRVVGGNEGIVAMFAGSASSVILGEVTGTSGTDGHLILAAPPGPPGLFKVVNRTGASRIFNIVVL